MGLVVALAGMMVPTEMMGLRALKRREYLRAGATEYRFSLEESDPRLPIRRHGVLEVVRWGNHGGRSRALPRASFTRLERVDSGDWSRYGGVPVVVAATYWSAGGAWCHVEQGMRGILAPDEGGWAVCFPICEPATNYYRNMTRRDWMPVLVEQRY